MNFYREAGHDSDGNRVIHYRRSQDDGLLGTVARVGGTWRASYCGCGHISDHVHRHEAELALCEAILGV